ncbi:MAG: hypothetical protein KZQ66_19320 [Candidatus Thiodiazotropha sp. (ex Lucinoma aequizonata)]|nr:hypothetical protein [Candidatus Thiodiazotropha sp. (ex Lucinoma aequizonata)]
MYRSKSRRVDDRIISISQSYVRPIIRGKLDKPVEFGAKLNVSLNDGNYSAHSAMADQIRPHASS